MARTLSLDLRERVVAAVEGGMSQRQAAERSGVSIASAVPWCARVQETGSVAAKPRGGDTLSARIEAQADLILKLVEETSDITLMELHHQLAAHWRRFDIGTLWRFFDRHAITWKKRARMRPSRTAPIS